MKTHGHVPYCIPSHSQYGSLASWDEPTSELGQEPIVAVLRRLALWSTLPAVTITSSAPVLAEPPAPAPTLSATALPDGGGRLVGVSILGCRGSP